jgi:predicted neuraminidase
MSLLPGSKPFHLMLLGLAIALALQLGAQEPLFTEMEIFSPQELHVHGSSVVDLPNGDLLACWFQGTGERWADDVQIMGARLRQGANTWTSPFVLADVPDFPDINPTLFIDGQDRLWLIWYTVLANLWETSLLKYRISTDYMQPDGPPVWDWQEVLHMKPGGKTERGIQPNDPFVATVERKLEDYVAYFRTLTEIPPESPVAARLEDAIERVMYHARGENMVRTGRIYREDGGHDEAQVGYPHFRRLGWQTQNKPVVVGTNRMLVPLYSDGFSFSIMAITEDWGKTWSFSDPIVGFGNIQPSIAKKADGTLVTYMRDNGPPPKRLHVSESTDQGRTWSPVRNSDLPNPGSGADVVTLANGHWVLVYNDTQQGRHSLAASLSTDDGATWSHTRHVERDTRTNPTSSHYPAVIEGRDGMLHLTYSYHINQPERARTIKYVRFNEAWLRAGADAGEGTP